MKVIVITSDEEITLFESDNEFETKTSPKNISINTIDDILAISNSACECLLDRIIKKSNGKWPNHQSKLQNVETFNFEDVEKIEILLR